MEAGKYGKPVCSRSKSGEEGERKELERQRQKDTPEGTEQHVTFSGADVQYKS